MSGETIDGGAPYEFDDAGHDPAFIEALEETQTEYREALDKLEVEPDSPIAALVEHFSPVNEVLGVNPSSSETKLNKRSILMKLDLISEVDDHGNSFACFGHLGENGHNTDGLQMPVEVWEDFGRPDTLTVVAYPKDMLN